MVAIQTVIVAFSMFSALPMPQLEWNEKNMRYALCCLPLVGVAVGAACWGWAWVCSLLGLPPILLGAGLCLLPVLVTGGVHMDGFADTCDALASHSGAERRREILNDPHIGAFGVIRLCCLFVASWALCASLPDTGTSTMLSLSLGFCLSRTLSGLAVATFPLAKNTGLAHTFATAANKRRVGWVLGTLALLLCVALGLCGLGGAAMVAVAGCVFLYYRSMSRRLFGGLTGDLAGWFLQVAELAMLAALVFVRTLEGAL